jgi:hypothetical protein
MRHIERNLFAYPAEVLHGNAVTYTLWRKRPPRGSGIACRGDSGTGAMGVRYRDMAVIVSDLEAYSYLIQRACARRGIPVFS